MADKPFLTDIKTLRERARKHIENGAVTEGYSADRETVIKVLNEALATEIVCVLRYRRHYFMASGINADSVAAEFLQHSNDEQGHADQIAQRIVQLGGEPNLNPDLLTVPNVVLTPHIASATEATRRAMANLAADNLIAALGEGPRAGRPPNPINPEVIGKARS